MADTRLQNLSTAIQTSLSNYTYYPASEWFNPEVGMIPKARLDDGYNLSFESDLSEFEDRVVNRVRVEIQFAMNPKKDLYLAAIEDIVTAVAGLKNISFTGKKRIRITEEIWTTTLISEKLLLLTFPEVYFEIGA